jgi:hypothetical protein
VAGQGASDCRHRHDDAMVVLEVPEDGVWAGVKTLCDELSTKVDDQIDSRVGDRRGCCLEAAQQFREQSG